MTRARVGASPIESQAVLGAVLGVLRRREAFASPLDVRLVSLAWEMHGLLPSHYLPDIYLEQPLMGRGGPRALLVLDAADRNYLKHVSDGSYLAEAGIPELTSPEGFDWLCGLVATEEGVVPFSVMDDSFASRLLDDDGRRGCLATRLGPVAGDGLSQTLAELAGIPGRVLVRTVDGRVELTLALDRAGTQGRFSRAPYRAELLGLLARCGCDGARLANLDRTSVACGISCPEGEPGPAEWTAFADPAYATLCWERGRLVDCRVGVLVTDRLVSESGAVAKPSIAYQWHITDNCDQRCRHCYLFAEDARMRCVSTPWEQLVHTLDEVEDAASRRGLLPVLAITGGDPILHPRFWDLAEELHHRGIRWTAMGNPFHLSKEVCQRLRQLGCGQYQMSLDGLEAFHDGLRKPGSYRATLDAIPLITGAGIKAQLMATASRQNLDDILACMDVAVEHGASSFAFARYCATSPQRAAELYPTPEEYRAFLLAYWEKKRAYERAGCPTRFKTKDHLFVLLRRELGEFVVPEWSRRDPGRLCGGCHLGSKSTIASNGDLLACRRMASVVGNIRTDHLYDVDTGPGMRAYAEVGAIERCRDCELLMWCRGCRAVGFNATGDLQAADPMCWAAP